MEVQYYYECTQNNELDQALRRQGAVIGIYIAFLLVPGVMILALSFISDWVHDLLYYELTISIGLMVQIDTLTAGEIARTLIVGFGYMAAAVFGGYYVFRKAEVK